MTLKQLAMELRPKIELFADQKKKYPELVGMCAISSFCLVEAINRFPSLTLSEKPKVTFGFYLGRNFEYHLNHVWVEVGRLIYDLTATQFPGEHETLLITDVEDKRYQHYRYNCWYEDFKNWNDDQRPTPEIVEEVLSLKCEFSSVS